MNTTMKKLPAKPVDRKKQVTHWLVAICTIVIIIWSFTGINFGGIKATAGQIAGAIFAGIFHPDWSYIYKMCIRDRVSEAMNQ